MRIAVTVALILSLLSGIFSSPASAQGKAQTSIQGTVRDERGAPISGARVVVTSPSVRRLGVTDPSGHFAFEDLLPDTYVVQVSKAGFLNASQQVPVFLGESNSADFTLATVSLETLATVTAVASRSLNTGPAAITTISNDVFAGQGETGVAKVLNETPGIVATFGGTNVNGEANGAAPSTYVTPQIRGALPYETATLIDGHALTVGFLGAYDVAFIDPSVLQGVEIVKGPGAWAPNLNYAITGTANFRTLEPTLDRKASFEMGFDQWGGQNSSYRATGTAGRLGYAFDYSVDGTPGPLHNYQALAGVLPYLSFFPQVPSLNAAINGQPICAGAGPACNTSYYSLGSKPNVYSNLVTNSPIVGCCVNVDGSSTRKNELGKLRYNFSQQTALTFSYLGTQANYDEVGNILYTEQAFNFTPPAGYTGQMPAGSLPCCAAQFTPYRNMLTSNLYEADFRTTAGNTTFLARYYASYNNNTQPTPGDNFPGDVSWNLKLYGGIPLNGSTTPTIFNGQQATFTMPNEYSSVAFRDRSAGETFEVDQAAGNNLYTLSYDSTVSKSNDTSTFFNFNPANPGTMTYAFIPDGSGQTFTTVSLRGMLQVDPKVSMDLSDSNMVYTSHYTPNGGASFQDSTHSFNSPRAAVTWRPMPDLSWRLALGSSIAPPYLRLISSPSFPPTPDNYTNPHFFTQLLNSGNLRPETAFNYDWGVDARIGSPAAKRSGQAAIVSADAYLTNIRDQYLSSYSLVSPAYSNTSFPGLVLPLYASQTENIGHSRYKGLELAVRSVPSFGMGYVAQGDLIRAYPYDLPPGFYDTPLGKNTNNLAVLDGVNFQGSAYTGLVNGNWAGMGNGRVPYAMGYGELNYRWHSGLYALIGATYYGNNNSFNVPPFVEINASVRVPLRKGVYIQIAGDNLTNENSALLPCVDCGVPVPLVNGQVGLTESVNLGPPSVRALLHVDF